MEQYSKQSEQNQSIDQSYQQSQYSCKDNSISNNRYASRNSSLINSQPSLSYDNNDWLIQLIQLNPRKMSQILDWISSLINYLKNQTTKYPQNINSLVFDTIKPIQQRYFLFIEQFHQFFYLLKILDQNGHIVSFKIYQNSQKQPCLQAILNKIGRRGLIFLFNRTSNVSYINYIIQKRNPSNVIVIVQEPHYLSLTLSKLNRWIFTKKKINEIRYRYYYNSRKKIMSISEDIEKIINIQIQNIEKIRSINNLLNFEAGKSIESNFLLINMSLFFDEELDKNKIYTTLRQGVQGVHIHQQKWQQSSKNHFPGSSQLKKAPCNYCMRKKIDVICKGCSYVYGKEINLCIGECFHKFHEERCMFMNKQKAQIGRNIAFFDKNCKQIGNVMDVLIQQETPDYLQFVNYLQARMINTLGKIISKQYAIDDDEAQTNQ